MSNFSFRSLLRDFTGSSVLHLAPRFASTLLVLAIGRLAGPVESGTFSLGLTYLLLSTTFFKGLDDYVTREISGDSEYAQRYLKSILTIRVLLSVVLYIGICAVVNMLGYSKSTTEVVLIMALSLIPDGITYTLQSVFIGFRRFWYPTLVITVGGLIRFVAGLSIVRVEGKLQVVSLMWLFVSIMTMIVMWIAVRDYANSRNPSRWLDKAFISQYWRTGAVFIGITVLTGMESQVDAILLSIFHSESEIGWYRGATTVISSLVTVSQAYRLVVYPHMAKYVKNAPAKLQDLYQRSLHYLIITVMPMVAGLLIIAPKLVHLIWGRDFVPTTPILQLLAPTLIFVFLNVPNSRVLLVHNCQGQLLRYLSISLGTNILINLLLIPYLGGKGSAIARLVSSCVFFALNYLYARRYVRSQNIVPILSHSLAATIIMVLVLSLVMGNSILSIVILGVGVYSMVLLLFGWVWRLSYVRDWIHT